MKKETRQWIAAAVEDANSDMMGVIEMFEVDDDVAEEILGEAAAWVSKFTRENL